jgi:putative nucleotidyltransferase with HDIG domain
MQGSMYRTKSLGVANSFITQLQKKHGYSAEHCFAVEGITAGILETISHPWSQLEVDMVLAGARFHDLGKLRIPNSILDKPGKLTAEEFTIIQNHPGYGVELLQQSGEKIPQIVYDIVRYHHEAYRQNCGGYPTGVAGEDIPLAARVVAVADVWHALTSARSYKPAMAYTQAAEILQQMAGTKLDPFLVRPFLQTVIAVAA